MARVFIAKQFFKLQKNQAHNNLKLDAYRAAACVTPTTVPLLAPHLHCAVTKKELTI